MTPVLERDGVVRLAETLASRTGETVTGAATIAIRERLERVVPRIRSAEEGRAAIAAIEERVATKLAASGKRFPTMHEMDDELYDENGLPH